jgi:tetratricopeptide (TPR) repeat protein
MNRLNALARYLPLVTLGVLLSAPSARAADLTPAQKQEMKTLYEKATRAYDVGKYNEAIEDYQKAYEIGGDPPMLYNIAQAYRLNDQPVEAVRFYRRYLQRAPSARNREDVERKIADLEKTIEDRRKAAAAATPPPVPTPPVVPVTPPTATPPQPNIGPPAPNAGTSPSPPPGAPETTPQTPPAPPEESGHTMRTVGWVLLGGGVAFGAGALATGLMARSKGQDVTNMSNSDQVFDPNVEHSGKLLNNLTIAFGATAGALAVTGTILVLVSSSGGSSSEAPPAQENTTPPPTTPPSAMVAPWLGNGLVGAGAAFRF